MSGPLRLWSEYLGRDEHETIFDDSDIFVLDKHMG